MTVCETCWEAASRHALYMGGSVVDHYRRLLLDSAHANELIESHEEGL